MSQVNLKRLFKSLAKQGLDVTREGDVYGVRLRDRTDLPSARILLPAHFKLEAKAVKQLAKLASVRHPDGGRVERAVATPDFHPGDSGIAIGSVVKSHGQIIPESVGGDINCGMRLHVADIDLDTFLSKRDVFVDKLKGDYFFGTRDVTQSAQTQAAMFQHGLLGWHDAQVRAPLGSVAGSDWAQLLEEIEHTNMHGSMAGATRWAPVDLVPDKAQVRDGGLATIGGGNHFVEIQVVDAIFDTRRAWQWGVRKGQLAFMIHSGSRLVGKYIGRLWKEKARKAWPAQLAHPDSGIFPIADPALIADYLEAQATAANYGFVNRMLLAELMRLRLREVFGDVEAPLVYDLPHNIVRAEDGGWVSRKGACPAHTRQPVIIPGSMGTASYLMEGLGNADFLCSASHGAGRAHSRHALYHKQEDELGLKGVDCITLKAERRREEAPLAYKPIHDVIEAQEAAGMVQRVARLRPILTFKA